MLKKIVLVLLHVSLLTAFQDVPTDSREEVAISSVDPPRSETLLSGNEESSDPQNGDVEGSRGCSCTYDYENSFVKARVGRKVLKGGDAIMRGETVTFECKYVSKVLTWQNKLRYFGRANMTCSTCEVWQSNDLPYCIQSMKINAVLGSEEDLAIFPGGIADVRKGESRRFFCSSIWKQPQWNYDEKNGVSQISVEEHGQGETIYVSYLDITNAGDEHNGEYECFIRGVNSRRTGSTFLHLRVNGACNVPLLDNGEMGNFETRITRWQSVEEFKTVPAGELIHSGQTLYLRCKEGFTPVEDSESPVNNRLEVTCNGGSWSKPLQCKQIGSACNVPLLENGEMGNFETRITRWQSVEEFKTVPAGELINSGQTLYLRCKEGFTPVEDSESPVNNRLGVTCNGGSWSKPLQCKQIGSFVSCPRFLDSRRSSRRVSYSNGVSVGSIAKFRCIRSTNLIGSSFSICLENGNWSHPEPSCEKLVSCSRFPFYEGLQVTYSDDVSVGSTATFSCSNSARNLIGSSTSVCQEDGRWSDSAPSCENSQCPVSDLLINMPESVEPVFTSVMDDFVSPGSEVEMKCTDNYIISGHPKALCGEDGKWNFGSFQCVTGCKMEVDPFSTLLVDPVKDSYRIGESVLLSCPPGQKVTTKVERIMCFPGRWSDSLPDCEWITDGLEDSDEP